MTEPSAVAGIITFDFPSMGTVHKEWLISWPPPEHIAVSRIVVEGREPVIGVLPLEDWANDRGIMPHSTHVWIYDQVSVSQVAAPGSPDWAAPDDGTTPLLPAAVYIRRTGAKNHLGGRTNGSRPTVTDGPQLPEGEPAADPG